jgi:hypothetical protein
MDVRLWQFFYRVKKETKDKIMVKCSSMTFMLRTKRMFPTFASHESVWYWNTGWFYLKNISVPGCHDGLPPLSTILRRSSPSGASSQISLRIQSLIGWLGESPGWSMTVYPEWT